MPGTLVVVESPAKAKTIEKYLGADYAVRASFGHVRDLPKSQLGVDVDDGFEPVYEVPEDSKRHVADLKRALKGADELVLATDYDREGEAIAYHVATLLGVRPDEAKRITFTEITRDAILESVRHPRAIDLKLVDAQEARRILDRLVGYRISPILWKKVRPGLSAGRVQSVAVRLIVEREREIRAFNPVEYWSIDVRLSPDGPGEDKHLPFVARLTEIPEGKLATAPDKKGILLGAENDATPHVERLGRAAYQVTDVQKKERKRSPAPPFTTSTLQQEAARKLGYSARKTMSIAQRLYEGVSLPGEGSVGLITYMRTDSVNIADSALREIAELVKTEYGASYALSEHRRYKTRSRNAQEAHEAVRPTSVLRSPERVAAALDRDQLRLYDLIWKRTVATQMAEARFDQVGVDIQAVDGDARYGLRATGQTLVFDGFIRVYTEGRDEGPDEDAESRLPELTAEQLLRLLELLPEQHFTQPPPRFSEASLVKTLEELGIGRPSTYASIIQTIQARGYVRLDQKRFIPEDVAEVVTDKLIQHFPDIVDVHFTARMEDELDDIAEGKATRVAVLKDFYVPFAEELMLAEEKFERYLEELEELCPKCPTEGREPGRLQVRLGRFGKFIGCSGYPDCRYIKKEPPKSTGVTCPQCGKGELVEKRTRFGLMYGCERYPECDCAVNNPPEKDIPCPDCGGLLLRRPKSFRCWHCGAEADLDLKVTKPGDREAEAAARAAKSEARKARAAARAKKPGASRKTTAAKKKAPAKKKTTTKKKTAATKTKPPATRETAPEPVTTSEEG